MVDYILERVPLMFLLENVVGWGQKLSPGAETCAMQSIEDRLRASSYSVFVVELGTEAWSKGRRTSLYMVWARNVLADASSDAAQRRFTEILQNIVLQRAAREPANWDEWLIRPSDSGYSMMLARYASQQVYTEMERSSTEDRAYVN